MKYRLDELVSRGHALVSFNTQKLAREFGDAFDLVVRYIETADLRGDELSWKNYREKYLGHARRARTLLRRILRDCNNIGRIQPVAKSILTALAVVWDVETETKAKVDAVELFKRYWKDFLRILEEEVSHPYDVFPNRDFETDERLCFVIMPFDKKMTRVYSEAIKPAVRELGLKCKLARDMSRSTPIMQDVWELINRARIVIADLTGRNPNVFYELGLSHSLAKRTVLVTQNPKDVPFDIKHIRYVDYENSPTGRRELRARLRIVLRSVLRE